MFQIHLGMVQEPVVLEIQEVREAHKKAAGIFGSAQEGMEPLGAV